MKTITKTVHIADDGREFDSKEACLRHETVEIVNAFATSNTQLAWVDEKIVRQVIGVLLSGYTITPIADELDTPELSTAKKADILVLLGVIDNEIMNNMKGESKERCRRCISGIILQLS